MIFSRDINKNLNDDIIRYILSYFLTEKDIFNLICSYDINDKRLLNLIKDDNFYLNHPILFKKNNILKSTSIVFPEYSSDRNDDDFIFKNYHSITFIQFDLQESYIDYFSIIKCDKLKELYLDDDIAIDDLYLILENHKQLTHLSFGRLEYIPDSKINIINDKILSIIKEYENLEYLELNFLNFLLNMENFQPILFKNKNLKDIELPHCKITDELINYIFSLNIESLYINLHSIKVENISPTLKKLSMTTIDPDFKIDNIPKQLESFIVEDEINYTDFFVKFCERVNNLKELNISSIISNDDINFIINKYNNLISLELYMMEYNVFILKDIFIKCKKLEIFCIQFLVIFDDRNKNILYSIFDGNIKYQLKELYIYEYSIFHRETFEDNFLIDISKSCPKLIELNIPIFASSECISTLFNNCRFLEKRNLHLRNYNNY